MNPTPSERQKEIFGLALELPLEDRMEFVRQQCADLAQCEVIFELIRKHEALPGIFESSGDSILEENFPALQKEFRGTSRFQLIRPLGKGGFGTVHEALDRENGVRIALKVLQRPEAAELMMFKSEFRKLTEITHPHLIQLYELKAEGGHWFFTMELVRGTDFLTAIRAGVAPLRLALRQLVEAVCHLHDHRMLHRDIKPSNILVTAEGDAKLLDFGLIRDLSGESMAKTQTVCGTAAYMAPELPALNEASDWYSVGAVLYEALTGRPPFQGGFVEVLLKKREAPARPPQEMNPDVPEDLNQLCVNLLERNPKARLNGAAILQRLAAPEDADLNPRNDAQQTLPLIGRDAQLAHLGKSFEEVLAGKTVCVHVNGPSGMGKTALCKQFLWNARRQGAVVLSGRCYETESVPFKALDPIVDALGDYLKHLPEADTAGFLPRRGPLQALSRIFPALLAVDAISRAKGDDTEESSRDLQRRAIGALKEILARIAEKVPCVVHIDDFQWGDLDSVECLSSILAPPDPPRVLFLFSYRSEDMSVRHLQRLRAPLEKPDLSFGEIREIPVPRLSSEDCRELVLALLGPEAQSAHEWIERETEGLPLFIHELARNARSWSGTAEQGRGGVSFQEIIRERVGRLSAPARRMLEAVSIAAQPIDLDLIRQVTDLSEGAISARNILVAQRLIRFKGADGSGELEPYHDKIREAVVAGLTPAAKREYFQSLAAALEARENADPEIVYQYFLDAGDTSKAEKWLEIAADRAEHALAFDLAAKLREKRAGMGTASGRERTLLLERLAHTLALAGQGKRAAQSYQAAAQGVEPARYRELIRKAGEQYVSSGNFAEGQALLIALLQKTGFRVPAHRWQALLMLLAWRMLLPLWELRFEKRERTGGAPPSQEEADKLDICRVASLALAPQDPIRSTELQARHLLHSLRLGEPYRIANSLSMQAAYLVARHGHKAYAAATRIMNRAETLALSSNHPNGLTLGPSVRTKIAWLAGQWKESATLGEEANRLSMKQGTRVGWEAYPSSIFWMCSLACLGEWRNVMECLPGLLADSQARGDLLAMDSLPVFTFAYIRWLLADKPENAAKELVAAQEKLNEPGSIPHRFGICYGMTEVAVYTRDTKRAREAMSYGWAQLKKAMVLRLEPVRILMLHMRGRVACAAAAAAPDQHTRKQFLGEAKRDARRIRKARTGWGGGLSDLLEAAIAAEEHRFDDARRWIESAEQAFLEVGMGQFLAAARYRKAQLLRGEPRMEAARQAAAWFDAQKTVNHERIAYLLSPGSWDAPE